MSKQQSVVIPIPTTDRQRSALLSISERAEGLVIDSAESHAEAQMIMKRIKAWKLGVKEMLKDPKSNAHKTWRSITKLEADLINPAETIYRQLEQGVIRWGQLQKKIADEEARRRAAAQKEADERAALEAAEEAEEAGDAELAEEILEAQAEAPEPVIVARPEVAKVDGMHETGRWKAEEVDAMEAVRYIAKNPQWVHLVKWDMPKLHALARAQREAFSFPGFKASKTTGMTVKL